MPDDLTEKVSEGGGSSWLVVVLSILFLGSAVWAGYTLRGIYDTIDADLLAQRARLTGGMPDSTQTGNMGISAESWTQAAIDVGAMEERRIGREMGPNQLAVYRRLVETMYPGKGTKGDLHRVMLRAMEIARASRVQPGPPPPDEVER